MQRKAIAALMISLLLLSACGHGAGEQTFEAFRDTLTGKLVTVTAQVRVQRGDTVTDYTLTCQELSVDDTLCLRCTMENWNLEQGSMNDESQDPNLGRDQSQ